ncbi:MAG: oligosaccharide flippase family protein [Bacteroidaceae bacterium]|nr:oligosaccharide flippase family protein [Bacteroidaceae bacterium]
MTTPTKKSVFRATSLMGGVQVLNILVNIIRNKIAATLIGAAGMGLADLYTRTADFLAQATNFGIGISSVRELAAPHAAGRQRDCAPYVRLIRPIPLWLAVLGAVVCLVAAPLLSRWSLGGSSITRGFWKLAAMVAFLTLTTGETAILKATKQLRQIALSTTLAAVATLIYAAVFYSLLGMRGIIPVLVASTGTMWILTLRSTLQNYPFSLIRPSRELLRQSRGLLAMGLALVSAGILGSGSEMVIRQFIISHGSLEEAGLYAAGLTLTVSYARIIFSAMDADYYPRLSATMQSPALLSTTVNRQIDVLVMLMAPFLILFALLLPVAVKVLYTREFVGVEPMVLTALCYMFFKAIYSPIAYIPLAAGHSKTYFIMELTYDVAFCLLVVAGFTLYGIVGTGIALSLANALDLLLLWTIYHHRYHYHMEGRTLLRAALQLMLLSSTLVLCLSEPSVTMRAVVGTPLLGLSAILSVYSYRR